MPGIRSDRPDAVPQVPVIHAIPGVTPDVDSPNRVVAATILTRWIGRNPDFAGHGLGRYIPVLPSTSMGTSALGQSRPYGSAHREGRHGVIAYFAPVTTLLLSVAVLLAGNGLQGTLLPIRVPMEAFKTPEIGIMGAAYYVGFAANSVSNVFEEQEVEGIEPGKAVDP
jgi:hypothetical protein